MRFHYLARAVIFDRGKVLLAHQIGADNTFLPGGHIGDGEGAEKALMREIKEELAFDGEVRGFVGAVESVWYWPETQEPNHEINLVFEVEMRELNSNINPKSSEGHLEFVWSRPSELETHNLLPTPLIECILEWNSNYRAYWGSMMENPDKG